MKRQIYNCKGFTLVESILGILLMSILMLSLASIFGAGAESFSMVKSRHEAMEKARYGMARIAKEIIYVQTADILEVHSSSFEFVDTTGTNTEYEMGTFSGQPALMRNNQVLIPNTQSINFQYYDTANVSTNVIADIRRIEVTIVITAEDNNGTVTLRNSIFPRGFIYTGFQ